MPLWGTAPLTWTPQAKNMHPPFHNETCRCILQVQLFSTVPKTVPVTLLPDILLKSSGTNKFNAQEVDSGNVITFAQK